jgi:hypothetical protein
MNNNDLICKICDIKYNQDTRKPMVLPCSHTFCLTCIKQLWEKKSYIKCPIDHKKCTMHIDKIQSNQFLLNMLSGKVKAKTEELMKVSYKVNLYKCDRDSVGSAKGFKDLKMYRLLGITVKGTERKIDHHAHNNERDMKVTSRPSFSFPEDKVSILFTYIDVIKQLMNVLDKVPIKNTYVMMPLRICFVLAILLINYILILYKSFVKVFMFIILINYTRATFKKAQLDDMTICIKRW